MRDCESSDEGVNVNVNGNGNSKRADFSSHSPINRSTDLIMKWVVEGLFQVLNLLICVYISHLSSDTPFPTNHALGMLSNLSVLNMGVQNLQNFQQHNDVLEKIKTQVRDMKVGFMNSDFSALHPSFTSTLQNSLNFSAAQSLQNASSQSHESSNGFPFSTTTATANKDGESLLFFNLIQFHTLFFNTHTTRWLMKNNYNISFSLCIAPSRLKFIDIKWDFQLVAAKQRLEFWRTIQTSTAGELRIVIVGVLFCSVPHISLFLLLLRSSSAIVYLLFN